MEPASGRFTMGPRTYLAASATRTCVRIRPRGRFRTQLGKLGGGSGVTVIERRPGIRRTYHRHRDQHPRGEATRLSPLVTHRCHPPGRSSQMIRLQAPLAERYTDPPLEDLAERIGAAKAALGDRLFILGHHYQRDEVIRWADARGDSFKLAKLAAERPEADYIVFLGVHFMAEAADILTADHQQVLLPDLNAGCSMADMADIDAVG